ncbi:MAG: redox-sensitive bicupin YhaK (pirin superfamily) [Myxococcota bacterium]|jgi:redox-sensitive bicupin YhaK (pirin superfamily)
MKHILQTLSPRMHSLGGLPVGRILPHISRKMLGPFIFMDYGGPVTVPHRPGAGVPEHPHAGLATFTYFMAGELKHRDSAGYAATIRSGDIALMTAGSGITHEELSGDGDGSGTEDLHFLQLWIALPDALEEVEPAFELHRQSDLPIFQADGVTARLAMGTAWGVTAPTTCHSATLFADIELAPGASVSLPTADELALLIIDGDAGLGEGPMEPRALHVLSPHAHTLQTSGGCRVLLLGGARFQSPRWIGGSFVASSKEKLDHWMRESATTRWPRIVR